MIIRNELPEFYASNRDQKLDATHLLVGNLRHDQFEYAYIYDFYRGNLSSLFTADAIIVEFTDLQCCIQILSKIRSSFDQALFLKPVFIRRESTHLPARLGLMSDGILSQLKELETLASVVTGISHRIATIDLAKDQVYEELIVFNFLSFLYSRDISNQAPIIDRNGIYYPVLADTIQRQAKRRHFLSVLEKMEMENYLIGEFDQSTYVCSECMGDHLLYREVCPSCHSAHLKSEEIVHHFRCANVAPLSDYRQQVSGVLECPKCQHPLKHIGVDYDKPGTMHYCQSCNANFQNYAMKACCTTCGHDQPVEHLIKKELKKYSLTDKAINVLKSGRIYRKDPTLEPMLEETLPWHLFIKTIDYEQALQSKYPNYLVVLHFQDIYSIIRQVGEENRLKLFNEIIQITRSTQQAFDFRGVKFPRIYFTLIKTRLEDAEIIAQRIVFLINHLLHDNLKLKRVMLTSEVLPMDGNLVQSILTETQISE